jgi:hypothetical protein
METLNVLADTHATTALEANTQPSKLIHMIPSSKIALRIADTDITSHYATHLRKAATFVAMKKRLAKHYGWTSAQAFVGWSQLFQGRLVHDWSRLQEAFLANMPPALQPDRKFYTGAIWTRKLISLLWVIMRAQWDHRNADRHGRTKEEQHAIKHARLMAQVEEQYAQGTSMLADDRDIIAEPITKKSDRSPAPLQLWLDRNIPIVKLSTKAATAAIVNTHEKLTSFFPIRKKPPALPGESHPNELDPEKPGPVYTP